MINLDDGKFGQSHLKENKCKTKANAYFSVYKQSVCTQIKLKPRYQFIQISVIYASAVYFNLPDVYYPVYDQPERSDSPLGIVTIFCTL